MTDAGNPFETRSETTSDENFDFEGATTNLIPAGEHIGEVVDLSKELSKKGVPMWVWTFKLVDSGEHTNKEIKYWTTLDDNMLWKRNQIVVVLGLGQPDSSGRIKGNFKKAEAIGKRCRLIIKDDEYKGNPTSSIKDVKALAA